MSEGYKFCRVVFTCTNGNVISARWQQATSFMTRGGMTFPIWEDAGPAQFTQREHGGVTIDVQGAPSILPHAINHVLDIVEKDV